MPTDYEEVEIPADVLELLESVDTRPAHARRWQPWEDRVLLEHWNTGKNDFLSQKILKCSNATARKRWKELTDGRIQ